MHGRLDEFEIRTDPTTDCGVSWPGASKIYVHIFGCFLNLEVKRTCIQAFMSSNFGQVGPRSILLLIVTKSP